MSVEKHVFDWDAFVKASEAAVPVTLTAEQARIVAGILKQVSSLTESRYEWAVIINHLACIALAEEVNNNDRNYAQDMIEMVNPYLGLASE